MKIKIALSLIIVFSLIPNYAVAGFEIVTQPQITPAYITRQGAFGPVSFPNPGTPAIQPAGTFIYQPPNFSRYSTATANRKQLWETPTGTELDANILAAMTGLKDKIRAEILQIRKDGSTRVSTDNAVVLGIYDSNKEAAKAVLEGRGDSTVDKARDGTTYTVFLTKPAAILGMTVPAYAQWIIDENNRVGSLVKRIDDEYMRLFYSVVPAETSVSVLLSLPAQYKEFSGL